MAREGTEPKTRSRTGCTACREKKIKCDESHPTCSNCARPGKVCVYELPTRNHHNPTMNSNLNMTGDLGQYFKQERAEYTAEQLNSFVPVPSTVRWVDTCTPDNYHSQLLRDQQNLFPTVNGFANSNFVRAQQTATHGLEALSAAAADYTSHPQFLSGYPASYAPNPAAANAHAIDPNLEAVMEGARREAEARAFSAAGGMLNAAGPRRGSPVDVVMRAARYEAAAREASAAGARRGSNEDAADEQLVHALSLHAQQADIAKMDTRLRVG